MRVIFTLVLAGALATTGHAADGRDTWNLDDLYPSLADWERAKTAVEARMPGIEQCQGHLGDSAQKLLQCHDLLYGLYKDLYRVYSYASLAADADTRDTDRQKRRTEAQILFNRFREQVAFINPELLAVGAETLQAYLDELPALAPYRQDFRDVIRQAGHTLDEEREQMLAATGMIRATAGNVYRTLANADMPWPTITLSTGEEVRLDQSAYGKHRAAPNRADRKAVMQAFFGKWKEYEATIGTVLAGHVSNHVFTQRQRGYGNSLEQAISGPNIPEAVYRTLVAETNDNLDTLHRYFRLRGRMLDVDDLGYHDIYPPLVESDKTYSLELAKQLTLEASRPLGNSYQEVMGNGFESRWMDAYPREGKRSGAYMLGINYDVHPYVLMNYNEDYDSVSTLAHEWGHAMHSYLSSRAQPFPVARYATFIAEIASTFNEALLLDLMLRNAESDQERLFYLGNALESLRGTFFRQTMFAEFELAIHEQAEAGQALTGATFTEIYGRLLRRYHGHDLGVLEIDDLYAVEWAYIPHFYRNFYVYQYATSLAASSLLAEAVLQGRPGAVEAYLNLLRSGSSDYPHELLLKAGVDMTSPEPYRAVFTRMNAIMDQIEDILDGQDPPVAP